MKTFPLILILLFVNQLLFSKTPTHTKATAPGYTIGLSMYSLHRLIESGELDPLDYPAFAKEQFGITTIDIWEGGFPKDQQHNLDYYKTFKARADAVGADVFLVMTGVVDARSDNPKALAKAGLARSHAVDEAVVLDAQYVRVFLIAADDISDAEAIERACLALQPLADYAQSKHITIVIEPGTSEKSKHGDFLAAVASRLNHPHCKLMPDFGKLKRDAILEGTIAMMPHAAVVSAKSYNFHPDGRSATFDYPALIEAIHAAKFTGIVAIEYEGITLPPVDGVRATQVLLEELNRNGANSNL